MINTFIDARTGNPVCARTGCDSDSHINGGQCTSPYNGAEWKYATAPDGKLYDTCPKCLKINPNANE